MIMDEKRDYRWIITRDRFQEEYPDHGGSVGTEGPLWAVASTKSNPVEFSLWDDDDNCMAEGMLYGNYDGFEPLDDFGAWNWGCTYVKIGGETLY